MISHRTVAVYIYLIVFYLSLSRLSVSHPLPKSRKTLQPGRDSHTLDTRAIWAFNTDFIKSVGQVRAVIQFRERSVFSQMSTTELQHRVSIALEPLSRTTIWTIARPENASYVVYDLTEVQPETGKPYVKLGGEIFRVRLDGVNDEGSLPRFESSKAVLMSSHFGDVPDGAFNIVIRERRPLASWLASSKFFLFKWVGNVMLKIRGRPVIARSPTLFGPKPCVWIDDSGESNTCAGENGVSDSSMLDEVKELRVFSKASSKVGHSETKRVTFTGLSSADLSDDDEITLIREALPDSLRRVRSGGALNVDSEISESASLSIPDLEGSQLTEANLQMLDSLHEEEHTSPATLARAFTVPPLPAGDNGELDGNPILDPHLHSYRKTFQSVKSRSLNVSPKRKSYEKWNPSNTFVGFEVKGSA